MRAARSILSWTVMLGVAASCAREPAVDTSTSPEIDAGAAPSVSTASTTPEPVPVDTAPYPILDYPEGPYGSGVGEVMPNVHITGYALSRTESDSRRLPFRDISLAEVRSEPGCECLVVTLTANGLGCYPSIMQDRMLTKLRVKHPEVCAVEVSWHNHDGLGPTVWPTDQPSTRADIDAFTQMGHENYPVGIPLAEARRQLSAVAAGAVPVSFIVDARTMRVLGYRNGTGTDFESDLMATCRTGGDPPIETVAKSLAPLAITTDGAFVYVADALTGILRVPAAGGPIETLAQPAPSLSSLAMDATHLYWTSAVGTTSVIARVAKDGGTPEVLLSDASAVTSFGVDTDRVWFTRADGVVGSVAKTGGPPTVLVSGEVKPRSILVGDTPTVHWIAGAREIARIPKAGGERYSLYNGSRLADVTADAPNGLGFFVDRILITTDSGLFSVKPDGAVEIVHGMAGPGPVQVLGSPGRFDFVFGTQDAFDHQGAIVQNRTTDTNIITVGQPYLTSIAEDSSYFYWTAHERGTRDSPGEIRRIPRPKK